MHCTVGPAHLYLPVDAQREKAHDFIKKKREKGCLCLANEVSTSSFRFMNNLITTEKKRTILTTFQFRNTIKTVIENRIDRRFWIESTTGTANKKVTKFDDCLTDTKKKKNVIVAAT